jgi:hypothetical protein
VLTVARRENSGMTRDDPISLGLQGAIEITCVALRRRDEITHVGGSASDGSTWFLSTDALIDLILAGATYYIQFEGNAYRVNVTPDDGGKRRLYAGFNENGLLLFLPRCSVLPRQ